MLTDIKSASMGKLTIITENARKRVKIERKTTKNKNKIYVATWT
jgi:hypothetical protein